MSTLEQIGESKLIHIRSEDRDDTTQSTSDFYCTLGSGVEVSKVKRVVLKSIEFTNAQYNIRRITGGGTSTFEVLGKDNNTLGEIGLPYDFPDGFYTQNDIIAILTTELNAGLLALYPGTTQTIQITWSSITSRFTLTVIGAGGVAPDTVLDIKVEATGFDVGSINQQLGFTTTQAYAVSCISNRPPRLNGLTSVLFRCDELAHANLVDTQGDLDAILLNIPVKVDYGQIMHYEPNDDELASINYKDERNISALNIQLIDSEENIVDLQDTQVEIILKVYF